MINTDDFTPPSSVSVSLKDDDCSCVSDADHLIQTTDNCNDAILNFNGAHNILHRLPSRSASRQEMNQVVIELLKENQEKEQELIALKLQLAKQEEKIDILSSRLSSRCQVENKYDGEKTDETAPATITMARDTSLESIDEAPKRQPPRRIMERRFSLSNIGAGLNNSFNRGGGPGTLNSSFSSALSNTNGSMQMLIDANGKLMQDNKRLEVSVDGLRRSFQSYIKLASQSERSDKEAIDRLQREVKTLQCQLDLSETSVADKKSSLQTMKQSFATQLTSSLEMSDDTLQDDKNHDEDYNREEYKGDEITEDDLYKIDNDTSSPPPHQNSNNDEEDKKSRNTTSSMDNRLSRSENTLLVDFGDRTTSTRRRSSMGSARRWQSQIVMTNNRSPM